MLITAEPMKYYYCCEPENGKKERYEEFMDCWRAIKFYEGFNVPVMFFLEEEPKNV